MELSNKERTRKEALDSRDAIPEETRAKLSLRIMQNLFSLPQWPPARGVMFFMSMRSEVDTEPMVRKAIDLGVRVALPRVEQQGRIEPMWINNIDAELETSGLGIREPAGFCAPAELADIGMVIVPGAAFDPSGARVGYGGGCFDRFLPTVPRALRVALAFDSQVVDRIDACEKDVPVDVLVTESGARVFYRRLTPADWNFAPPQDAAASDPAFGVGDAGQDADGAGDEDIPEPGSASRSEDADDSSGDSESWDSAKGDESGIRPDPQAGSGAQKTGKTMKRKKKRGKRR